MVVVIAPGYGVVPLKPILDAPGIRNFRMLAVVHKVEPKLAHALRLKVR